MRTSAFSVRRASPNSASVRSEEAEEEEEEEERNDLLPSAENRKKTEKADIRRPSRRAAGRQAKMSNMLPVGQ